MVEALVIAAGILGSAPVVRADLSLGAGGWSRLTVDEGSAAHGGVALLPEADLSMASPGATWTVRYAPQLLSDVSGSVFESWQEAGLKGRIAQSPRLELDLDLQAGFGRNEQLEHRIERTPFDDLDLLRPVVDDDLDTALDVGGSYQLGPLDRIDLSAGYFARGGLTDAARAEDPLQTGPELYLGFAHSLSPVETLGATFYGASTSSSGGVSSDGRLELAWAKSLSRTFRTRLTAGASASSATSDRSAELAPAGSVELGWSWPTRKGPGGLVLLASFAPRMDPITGSRSNRAEVSAALSHALTAELSVRAHGGFARQGDVASFALAGGDLLFHGRGGWSFALEAESVHQARAGQEESFLRVFTRAAYALRDVL